MISLTRRNRGDDVLPDFFRCLSRPLQLAEDREEKAKTGHMLETLP
ncbi:MAG: hypothetical protein ABI520_00380 [Caldimonas sp.]